MKYVALDLETTGLNPNRCMILQAAFVVEDTEALCSVEDLPTFNTYISHDVIVGEPYALQMNADIIRKTLEIEKTGIGMLLNNEDFEPTVVKWLSDILGRPPYVAAGKNVANFDLKFFHNELSKVWRHRTIDPGSVMLPMNNWSEIPDSNKCLELAGIGGATAHDALSDARDVIRILRTTYPS